MGSPAASVGIEQQRHRHVGVVGGLSHAAVGCRAWKAAVSICPTTSMTNHAKWSSGNQLAMETGSRNCWSLSPPAWKCVTLPPRSLPRICGRTTNGGWSDEDNGVCAHPKRLCRRAGDRPPASRIGGHRRLPPGQRRYRDARADVLFVEAPQSEDEVGAIAAALSDLRLLFNCAEGGRTPPISRERLVELGHRLDILAVGELLAATRAVRELLASIRVDSMPAAVMERLVPFGDFVEPIGLREIRRLEQRFGPEKTDDRREGA